jgi:protease I
VANVLMPLPAHDADPTETAVPWRMLTAAGHHVVFATPDGAPAMTDPRMLAGTGLGPFRRFLVADANARAAHAAMSASAEWANPHRHDGVAAGDFAAIVLPGGHAPGMRPYLESAVLQALVGAFADAGKPLAAVCHGVLLAARARRADGRSVLHGRRATALLQAQELLAWRVTRAWAGDYYRTYPRTVEAEVRAALGADGRFVAGPLPLRRDGPQRPGPGFAVRDGQLLTARWPGDAHRFAAELVAML